MSNVDDIKNKGGVWWDDAPIPPAEHECWTQTSGWIGLLFIERCACGAVRLNQRGDWFERNTRIDARRGAG